MPGVSVFVMEQVSCWQVDLQSLGQALNCAKFHPSRSARGNHQFTVQLQVRRQVWSYFVHVAVMPAGVNDSDTGKVDPQGQGEEPVNHFHVQGRIIFDFSQKCCVL